MLPAQTHLVHQCAIVDTRGPRVVVRYGVEDLGKDDDLLPRNVELLEGLADDDLGFSVGVCVGGVPGVDAAVVRCLEDFETFFLVEDPRCALPL